MSEVTLPLAEPAATGMRVLWVGFRPHRDQFAGEVVRRRARDPHGRERSRPQGAGEVHQLVVPGAAGEHGGVLLGRALDDDLLHLADPGAVVGERRAVDDDLESGEAVGDLVRVDEVLGVAAASVPGLGL